MTGESLGNVQGWNPKCPGCAEKGRDYNACVRVTLKEVSYPDGRCCSSPTHDDYDYALYFWCAFCGHVFYRTPAPEGYTYGDRP